MLQLINPVSQIRKVFLSLAIICSTLYANSQVVITGYHCVQSGVVSYFGVSGTWSSSTTMTWTCTGCTFSGSSTGTPLPSIGATFNSGGTVFLTTTNPSSSSSYVVSIGVTLQPGTISNPTQTIAYNTVPTPISASSPTGGDCSATTYTYQWQQSSDNSNFSDISGATSTSYAPPALTATTYYRRQVWVASAGSSVTPDLPL